MPSAAAAVSSSSHASSSDPVRVLFVSSHAQLGGGEGYLRSIIDGLGDAWTAGIVSLHDGPFVARLRAEGYDVDVIDAPGKRGAVRSVGALRRLIAARRPDVIHANGIKAAIVAGVASLGGPPVIWVKIDFGLDGWPAALAAAVSHRVVGISAAVNQTFRGPQRRKTRVVHAGIPDYRGTVASGTAMLATMLGGPATGPVVTLSGRLCPGKGQDDLIRATPRILEVYPDAKVLFIGVEDPFYPDHKDMLVALAGQIGVTEAIRYADLPGHSPQEAVSIVAASDVFAMPSKRQPIGGWKEGFGLAAVEAMQVGTPVVAYASGALPEVVADCGVVVPEGDVAGLAAGIIRMIDDAAERERIRARAEARALEQFSLERVVREMAACYREAVATSASSRASRRSSADS